MSYEKHLYMVLHPNNILIGSQLSPEDLGRHYLTGSSQHYNSRLIFAEIDINYRNDYFDIDWGLEELKPHENGAPKATKFISSYRVLEHIDFDAIKSLYIASSTGAIMELKPGDYNKMQSASDYKIYAGITPIKILAMSRKSFIDYGLEITHADTTKGAPKCFYTQIEFDAEQFQNEFHKHPLLPSPIPGVHPALLDDAIDEIRDNPNKESKGIRLHSSFSDFPMRLIRHGFMFASRDSSKFFPMPSQKEIEEKFYQFHKSM